MFIKLDKNKKQISEYSNIAGKNTKGAIEVDCDSPSEFHTLKNNYKKLKGEAQWKLDTVTKAKHDRKEKLQKKYNREKDMLIWNEVRKDKESDLNAEDLAEVDKKIKSLKNNKKNRNT